MVNRDGVSSRSLHLVEREVSIVNEVLGSRHCSLETAASNTQGHGTLDCGREVVTNTFGDFHGTGDIGIWEEKGELVPSNPTDQIECSPIVPEYRSDTGKHVVADDVPESVVDGLELIDINNQEAEGAPIGDGSSDRLLHTLT